MKLDPELAVKASEGVVKDEQARLSQERPGDGDFASLPIGELDHWFGQQLVNGEHRHDTFAVAVKAVRVHRSLDDLEGVDPQHVFL